MYYESIGQSNAECPQKASLCPRCAWLPSVCCTQHAVASRVYEILMVQEWGYQNGRKNGGSLSVGKPCHKPTKLGDGLQCLHKPVYALENCPLIVDLPNKHRDFPWQTLSLPEGPMMTGWWFGTFFMFLYFGNHHPN